MLNQILRGATWSLQETTGGNCVMCSIYYSSALPPQFHLVDHGVFWFCCSGQERQWFFSVESEADWSSRSPAPSLAPDHILYLVAIPGFLRCPFSSSWLALLTLWRALQSEAIVMSPIPLLTAPPTTFLPEATETLSPSLHNLPHGKNVCTHTHGLSRLAHHLGVVPFSCLPLRTAGSLSWSLASALFSPLLGPL